MAVRKLLERIIKSKPYNLQDLLAQVQRVRTTSTHLAICASPTGPNWLGIRNATLQLFPDACVELPQYYSQPLLTDADLLLLAQTILQQEFKNVVFSGFPPYFIKLIEALQGNMQQQLGIILHGTFSEVETGGKISEAMLLPLQLLDEKKISKVAAVRKDVAAFIGQLKNRPAYTLHNKCVVPNDIKAAIAKSPQKQIGIFGTENFNKNLHNQVCGAAMVPDGHIYVTQPQLYTYLNTRYITGIPRSNHHQFLGYLASMDVNLHLSFSESWGQIAAESMALGVPCLTSPNTNLLDNDEELKQLLTVIRTDSPVCIADQIETVLSTPGLGDRCIKYIAGINREADVLMQKFLESE